MKILVLTRYGALGASSRLRSIQYIAGLEEKGHKIEWHPLINDELLRERYLRKRYNIFPLLLAYIRRSALLIFAGNKYDLVWIEKEVLPWLPAFIERMLLSGKRYFIDFDDAIFHYYDLNPSKLIRIIFGKKILKMIAGAAGITAGNSYLLAYALKAGARNCSIIPTVVDLDRYQIPLGRRCMSRIPVVVWIGSPSTAKYLQDIIPALQSANSRKEFSLLVIGVAKFTVENLAVEFVDWSLSTEVSALMGADVGLMPLRATPWEQGKCAYKLIQYMACGLPVIASPVGANVAVVDDGINGYLAGDANEWADRLVALLEDQGLRHKFGEAGRKKVELEYSLQVTNGILERFLTHPR